MRKRRDRLYVRPQWFPMFDGRKPLSWAIYDGRRFCCYSWSLPGAHVALRLIRECREKMRCVS